MNILLNGLVLLILIFAGTSSVSGQEYVDEPVGSYVDEPIGSVSSPTTILIPQKVGNYEPKTAIYSGFINMSLQEAVFKKFTGYKSFSSSNSFTSNFINLALKRTYPIRYQGKAIKYLPAYAYGAEFSRFSENTETALTAAEGIVVAPYIQMDVYFWSINTQLYIPNDPFIDQINPFLSAGWGGFFGEIESRRGRKTYKTSFSGFQAYRSLGTQIDITESIGVAIEFRETTTTRARTSNDPFKQGTDETGSGLLFTNNAVNMTFYYVF